MAIVNAILIVMFSILKFTNALTNCYCGGSVLQRGRDTFVPIFLGGTRTKHFAGKSWIEGAIISSATFFAALVFLFVSKGDFLFKGVKSFKRYNGSSKDSKGGDSIREDDSYDFGLATINVHNTNKLERGFREVVESELNAVVSQHGTS